LAASDITPHREEIADFAKAVAGDEASFHASTYREWLKTLQGLTPYEFICKCWTRAPQRFTSDPHHQIPGPNI